MWLSANLAAPPRSPEPAGAGYSYDSGSVHGVPDARAPLSEQLEVRVLRLLDMPRDYHMRRPKAYIVRAVNEDEQELARTYEIEGFQGYTPDGLKDTNEDIENVELVGSEGILRLETTARLIFIQVEYSTGELIGRCHIHRLDPRSSKPWPYLLSDKNGNTVNCGIELELLDGVPGPTQVVSRPSEMVPPAMQPVAQSSSQSIGAQSPLSGLTGANNLFGPLTGSLNLELPMGPLMPTPIFGQVPNLLDVVRGRPQLQVDMASGPPAVTAPRQVAGPAAVTAPMQVTLAHPQVIGMPSSPPSLPADYEIWHAPTTLVREYPSTREYTREYPTTVLVDSAPYGMPLPAPPVEGDGLQELWCAPPPASFADTLFGTDMDLEVRADCSEAWIRPLVAHDAPLFEKNMHPERFPDMNVSLSKSYEERHAINKADNQHRMERAREKLPEFSFDHWVDNNNTRQKLALPAPTQQAPSFQEPVSQAPQPLPSPGPMSQSGMRRAQGKVRVESLMVSPEQARQIEEQCSDPKLVHLDKDLVPKEFDLQIVGCMELNETPGTEKRMWVRTPSSVNAVSRASAEALLQEMGTELISVTVTCQRGNRSFTTERGEWTLPNQDNFSMTKLSDSFAFYVVCDGHGPFGHLVSFRIAQSLPKFVLSELQALGGSAEQALLKGFEAATLDLATFAKEAHLDISSSGASCVAVLRNGHDVQIAWVGDSGALVATLLEDSQVVDMMTGLHTTDSPQELMRVQQRGAEVRAIPPHNCQRIFRPGANLPGIFVTRAFGDSSLEDYGVSWQPDVKKTSFEAMPGLVLLGTGGLWEVASRGEAVLSLLTKAGLHYGVGLQYEKLVQLSQLAQKIWKKEEEAQCFDDVTCLALHWISPGARRPAQPMRPTQPLSDMPPDEPSGSRRTKPTTVEAPLSQEELRNLCDDPAFAHLDPALRHPDVVVQVVGCVEAGDASFDFEKPAWLRRQGELHPLRVDGGSKKWLDSFASANIKVGALCRKGERLPGVPASNQDNFSITSAAGDRAIYVVCDGHGPVGHLVAFRVAQSLPFFIIDGLSSPQAKSDKAAENAILGAFRAAASDLVSFSSELRLDLSASGTTCAAVLREGDKVHVARLGDTRALIATVVQKSSRLDMMSQAHTPENAIERRRLQEGGLVITQAGTGSALQISKPGDEAVRLTVSRAFGDFNLAGHGLIAIPDVTKTSFTGVPGMVLLASGGMCEFLQDGAPGEVLLDVTIRQGMLLERGPDHALKALCRVAQEKWRQNERDYCEDVTGILIHWSAMQETSSTAVQQRTSLQQSQRTAPLASAYPSSSEMPRPSASPFAQETHSISAPRVLNGGIGNLSAVPSLQGGLQGLRSSPFSSSADVQSAQSMQSRKFLQADPQQGSALKMPARPFEQSQPKTFLQAQPASNAKRVQGIPRSSAAAVRPLSVMSVSAPGASSSEGGQSQFGNTPLSKITANAPSKLAMVPE